MLGCVVSIGALPCWLESRFVESVPKIKLRNLFSCRGAFWTGALLCVASFLVSMGFSGCMSFQMKEEEIVARFEENGQSPPRYFKHEDAEGMIFLARKGSGPTVVLVHGSPGSWDNFAHVLSDPSLNSQYTFVAVDRPGFGRSLPGKPEPSLETQARRIHNAVKASGVPLPAVWLGHSLGGPVIAKLAVDYPEDVAALVLVAPSMDPGLEKRQWFNWVAKFPPIKWGLSREWRNSNEEIFPHKKELEKLANELPRLRVPTIVLQGDKDSLVPIGNAYYTAETMPEGVVELRILQGVDHFIPWTNVDEMVAAIRSAWQLAD